MSSFSSFLTYVYYISDFESLTNSSVLLLCSFIKLEAKIAKSPQIEATNIIFKKNDHSKNFLREFERLLEFDPYLVTDKYNSFQNSEYFIENRHDQSVMSLISKIHGSVLFDNETKKLIL